MVKEFIINILFAKIMKMHSHSVMGSKKTQKKLPCIKVVENKLLNSTLNNISVSTLPL